MSDSAPALLTAKDLVVAFNDRVILDSATLALHEGSRVGLVGRNGTGKSTFLKVLAGLHAPDSGEVAARRGLVTSYLSQEFTLDPKKTVFENIRDGASHVLGLIKEFESLPADSKRHEQLEERIAQLDGWDLDNRIETAMSHLGTPPGDREITKLSGGEKRRIAMCRALVSRPDLLILDEPTNHLDPEAIEWVAEFLENFGGAFLVVTHDRWFLDRVTTLTVELAEGQFYSYDGGYSEYLLAKAERQRAEAVVEHQRQKFLEKELAWVRQGPRAQRSKQKNRFERYYETAAQAGPPIEEDMELVIPPPPPLGNRVVELNNLGITFGGRTLFRNFTHTFENGQRIGVAGRNGVGKTSLLKAIIGELAPTEGTAKTGQLTKFNYVDQSRLQLREDRTVIDEVSDGTEFVIWGDGKLSLRAYLKRFLFTDDRISLQVKYLSGGERSRLLLARILKQGGNFLILDEPTNDLDLNTLRVLEEALIAFPGVVLVVSHDRYFLNRVCTGIFAFEGDERIAYSVGDYEYYMEKKKRAAAPAALPTAPKPSNPKPAPTASAAPAKSTGGKRKLSFKEARELDDMENQVYAVEEQIGKIENLFADPEFHKTQATHTNALMAELAAHKDKLNQLYKRWEELEALKAAS
ncbi:MAG: ABC transporter [Pedosphaera sp. Tous-C6FEB]|nr:MAG: ABC transporter [Pedosphaera sp. Tous-C6FEB]